MVGWLFNIKKKVTKLLLKFYKQSATPYRVDKRGYLQHQGDIAKVVLKDNTNLMTPTFILKTNGLVYNSNYVYCDFTKRYYFINTVEALTGGRIAIHCKIDVLFTYREEIMASSAFVVRSNIANVGSDYDMLHNDYPFQVDYDILGYDLGEGPAWRSPFDPAYYDVTSRNIYLAIK